MSDFKVPSVVPVAISLVHVPELGVIVDCTPSIFITREFEEASAFVSETVPVRVYLLIVTSPERKYLLFYTNDAEVSVRARAGADLSIRICLFCVVADLLPDLSAALA